MTRLKELAETDSSCEIVCIDEEKVGRARLAVNSRELSAAAAIFKALSDETRLKIAYSLCVEEQMCVCDAAAIIGSSTATASHHLRLLKQLGLAKSRKEGKLVFYSLDDDHVKQLIMTALIHSEEAFDHDR
jgi:DNA-binding transcriptional ArsR family regulator